MVFSKMLISFYLIESFFKNQKEVWNYPPCLIFCMIFEEKNLSCYIPLRYSIEIFGNICTAIICFSINDVNIFEINFSFLINLFSKNSNILKTERAFKMK